MYAGHTPDTVNRSVAEAEIEFARRQIALRLPALNGRCVRAITCLYTNAPDGHFILDRHLALSSVLIVSPCSGHGFKFCPVIGEIVADLVERDETRHDIMPFRLSRL